MNTLGGVHQPPLYCRPRELAPLMPVVVDPREGEYNTFGSSSSTDAPAGASLVALIAKTYSYVVIP